MDNKNSEQNEKPEAVPYIPPAAHDTAPQSSSRSPLFNAMILVAVVLVGGFMAYNFVGGRLTQVATQSVSPETKVPPLSPTVTPSVFPTSPIFENY